MLIGLFLLTVALFVNAVTVNAAKLKTTPQADDGAPRVLVQYVPTGGIPPYKPPETLDGYARYVCGDTKCAVYNEKYQKTSKNADFQLYTDCLDICQPEMMEHWLLNLLQDLSHDHKKYRKVLMKQMIASSNLISEIPK